MTAVLDVVGDLDAALERLRRSLHANSTDEQRRAVRETLACVYELHAYREGGKKRKKQYHAAADACDDGKVTKAIVSLRGRMVHNLVKRAGPAHRLLAPSEKQLAPSEDLSPGHNLIWLRLGEMNPPMTAKDMHGPIILNAYDTLVAGLPVLQPLARVRRFLVEPTILGPL